ncbi:MAG: hypothetical protein JEY97_12595 [Bacteroidales bacterium]|nr:hypothetical protein [Bacteroidales bacterium]
MKTFTLFITVIIISLNSQSQSIVLNDTNWFRNGPVSADVRALAMAPSNPEVIYIGTYSDGIYKTTNGGETWNYCSTENLPVYEDSLNNSETSPCWWFGDYYPVYAIAVEPQNENHVWVGTHRGLLKSTDGGSSWQSVGGTLPDNFFVNFININSFNPNDIFIGTGGGFYRTINGGNSWDLFYSSYWVTDIKRDPSYNDHILIGLGSTGSGAFPWGIIESYDNGITWQELTDAFHFYDICIDPENNQNL